MQNLGGTKKPPTLAQVRREWVQDLRRQPGNLLPPSTAASQVLRKKKVAIGLWSRESPEEREK